MASKDHVAFVDDERIQEPELPNAGGDLTNLFSRMRSGVFGVGPNCRDRRPFDSRRARISSFQIPPKLVGHLILSVFVTGSRKH